MEIVNQQISLAFENRVSLYIKREDLIHPYVSGNKYRKLKYNLAILENSSFDSLVTFGGAFSNHIAATAFACMEKGINCVGVIRGEELWKCIGDNPTLKFAQECGMKFEFVTREQYRNKDSDDFKNYLFAKYGNCFVLPEGGSNPLAVKGCEEILTDQDVDFDYICCAVGTGGTVSGVINSANSRQKVIGFSMLKGDFLQQEICKFAKNDNWYLETNYHFGGYAKVTPELIDFINDFYQRTNIPLDPIYTGKLVYGVLDLIKRKYFQEGSKILMIHTGGLQGIKGMNEILTSKGKKTIQIDV